MTLAYLTDFSVIVAFSPRCQGEATRLQTDANNQFFVKFFERDILQELFSKQLKFVQVKNSGLVLNSVSIVIICFMGIKTEEQERRVQFWSWSAAL